MDEFEVEIGDSRFDPVDRQHLLPGESDDDAPPEGFLVQLFRPPAAADISRLRRQFGLSLREYVPNLAYIERLNPRIAQDVQADELVRACVPYTSELKRSPMIGRVRTNASDDVGPGEPQEIDFILFDDSDPGAVTAALEQIQAATITLLDDRSINGRRRIRATLPSPADIDGIAQLPDVRWVEPVGVIVDDNHIAASIIQSGDPIVAAIWKRGLHGENQIIGILDSSPVDLNHCFFKDPSGNAPGSTHRKVIQVRNATGSAPSSHATFVAGCAAGDDFDLPGNAPRRGGAWAAQLISGNRRDLSNGSTILEELTSAASAGAFIHSNSWHADAGNPTEYNQLAADVDTFLWTNEDHLVLGSSGNSGEEQGPPGTAKNAVCVSAARSHPHELEFGDGNRGPTKDGRRKPDLVAVGCGIESAKVGTPCTTGTRSACATSYATPHVAAAAALVRQYFTEGWYPEGTPILANAMVPSGALLKAVLLNSTREMIAEQYPSDDVGWGLVQLDRSLVFSGDLRRLLVHDKRNTVGLLTGQSEIHEVEVVDSDLNLKVTLVWTEPPGSVGAGSSVVNDLDLKVTDPTGASLLGSNFANGHSIANGVPDKHNNVEMVLVEHPAEGSWMIEVRATQINVADPGQGYALCVTGGIAV